MNSLIKIFSITLLGCMLTACNDRKIGADDEAIVIDSASNIEVVAPDSVGQAMVESAMKNYIETNTDYKLDTISYANLNSQRNYKARQLQRELMRILPKIDLKTGKGEDEVTRTYYIIEGDIRVDDYELLLYCYKRLSSKQEQLQERNKSDKLTVATTITGQAAIWQPGTVLKYFVSRSSFSTKAKYDEAVRSMQIATKEWAKVCNIKFQYLPQLDNRYVDLEAYPENALFMVREVNSQGEFLAQAFFPHYPKYNRMLLLDSGFFTTTISRVGILRHEIGHVLGFRHEHIWLQDGSCPGEQIIEDALGAEAKTLYDPYSVMHYPCGLNVNNTQLLLTDFDKKGALLVYPF
ncbi:matrixin family metalloprotease [Flavobacterium subsaxonicum]|uniref:matrixin family metalloprotease n=1 Tax=Flavobacterium subsaxonicum TaxID=426226 RepID=UPI0003FB5D57|nr:M57 family metalloprotease [Flavobacterium subsaxonicum]